LAAVKIEKIVEKSRESVKKTVTASVELCAGQRAVESFQHFGWLWTAPVLLTVASLVSLK
jgi:hypothetical protein